jgi:hypothetical protein
MKSVTGVKPGESARAYVSQASYDSGGGLNRALLGNGRWEDWDYNERKQVVSIKLGSVPGAGDLPALGFEYRSPTINNNGNVLSQTIVRPGFSATQTYTYDDYNRIKKVEEGDHFRDFRYKEPGNMYVPDWSPTAGWQVGSFTPASAAWFDEKNRLVNPVLGIQYDAAGNQTADVISAVTTTPMIQQQIAGLADGGTYTFYVWARVASGTRKVSIAIVDNAYAAYLAGPTQITLTTSWQRFKITGTLASGQTGLWIVVRQYAANGDDWTTGDIRLWEACLQQGDDPKKAYSRTSASQTPHISSGLAAGPTVIAAPDSTTSPLKIHGPGSNLADSTLLELTPSGELILAGGSGNGYRFAELGPANNPSGWSCVLKVKTPAGTTLGYILLYTNP